MGQLTTIRVSDTVDSKDLYPLGSFSFKVEGNSGTSKNLYMWTTETIYATIRGEESPYFINSENENIGTTYEGSGAVYIRWHGTGEIIIENKQCIAFMSFSSLLPVVLDLRELNYMNSLRTLQFNGVCSNVDMSNFSTIGLSTINVNTFGNLPLDIKPLDETGITNISFLNLNEINNLSIKDVAELTKLTTIQLGGYLRDNTIENFVEKRIATKPNSGTVNFTSEFSTLNNIVLGISKIVKIVFTDNNATVSVEENGVFVEKATYTNGTWEYEE